MGEDLPDLYHFETLEELRELVEATAGDDPEYFRENPIPWSFHEISIHFIPIDDNQLQ